MRLIKTAPIINYISLTPLSFLVYIETGNNITEMRVVEVGQYIENIVIYRRYR